MNSSNLSRNFYRQSSPVPTTYQDTNVPTTYQDTNNETWQDTITNLLTAMVVVDGKVLPIEVETLQAVVSETFSDCGLKNTSFSLDKDRARQIYKKLKGPGSRFWLGNQHMKLKEFEHHDLLLEKLWQLSVCDGVFDESEGQLIDIFAHLWQRF